MLLPLALAALHFVFVLVATMVLSGLIWIPACRIHRRRKTTQLSTIATSLYFVPALALLWIGLFPARPTPLGSLGLTPAMWGLLLALTALAGLRYYRRAVGSSGPLFAWLRSLPGLSAAEPTVPADNGKSFALNPQLAIPLAAGLVSLVDIAAKLLGFFKQVEIASFLQFFLASGSVVTCIHLLLASKDETSPLGSVRTVSCFPKATRITSAATTLTILTLWAIAAGTEPKPQLAIASATLPSPTERALRLTLVNRGEEVRILTRFEIESRTWLVFQCLSADFSIPIVAQYKLKFHLSNPLTEVSANPQLQFQKNKPAMVDIALDPNAIGNCADDWTADVRVAVVADDGRRSTTDWFTLRRR